MEGPAVYRVLLLITIISAVQTETNSTATVCQRNEACRLVEKIPLVIEIGSGEELESYDRPFHYEPTTGSTDTHDFCECPEGTECPTEDSDSSNGQSLQLGSLFTIKTCRPLANILRPCRNFLHPMIRVFKQLEVNGTQSDLTFVRAKVYCHCPTGLFKRGDIVEPWADGAMEAITFYCVRDSHR